MNGVAKDKAKDAGKSYLWIEQLKREGHPQGVIDSLDRLRQFSNKRHIGAPAPRPTDKPIISNDMYVIAAYLVNLVDQGHFEEKESGLDKEIERVRAKLARLEAKKSRIDEETTSGKGGSALTASPHSVTILEVCCVDEGGGMGEGGREESSCIPEANDQIRN